MKKFSTLLFIFLTSLCFGQDYYPLQIGNRWVYTHSERPALDVIEIVDTTRINENLYYKYKETQIIHNQTFYSYVRKDSLNRVWRAKQETQEEFLTFLWFDHPPGLIAIEYDSISGLTYVHTLEDTADIISTPAGVFQHCYHFRGYIEEIYTDFNQWFAPGIGHVSSASDNYGLRLKGAYVNGILYGDTTTTSVNVENSVSPDDLMLFHNFPNPFNQSTAIYYNVPKFADGRSVRLELFNMMGQRVRVLLNKSMASGEYWTLWNGNDEQGVPVASGIYILNLMANNVSLSRKITLTR